MDKKINLYWYQHPGGAGNFGDALNPYIVEKLSGIPPRFYNINLLNHSKFLNLKVLVKNLQNKKINFSEFLDYFIYDYLRHKKVILAIGSILRYKSGKNFLVWGSGIIKASAEFGEAKFLAVRGRYTEKRLIELNYNLPVAYGDPAILLPKIYKPTIWKKYKLGIIPHFIHYEELKNLNNTEIKIINLLNPVEDIIEDINSCELTISTSLHGIIVSHSYKIPSLWIEVDSPNKLFGDNIKFKDYFSSVDLEEYQPFVIDENNFQLDKIIDLFRKNTSLVLPRESIIEQIQKSLIDCAPFNVQPQYKND